jgi:enamine deaminase RidA (YjgF/YER057c/UK114 family)/tetratricopeptide (TPR) repeat protein
VTDADITDAAPGDPEAWHAAALDAFRQGRLAEAVAWAQAAVSRVPDRAAWWRNLCTIAERHGNHAMALAAAERAVALAPSDPDLWHALALVQYRLGAPEASAASARAALHRDADHAGAHVALAEALLLQGEFATGWDEYEWRYRLPGAGPSRPPLTCAAWDGTPLPKEPPAAAQSGRLLLVADQGYGDAIQFARYIPWAAARCGAVSLAAAPELTPLLAPLLPPGAVLAGWEAVLARGERYAAWAPLSGLPRLHGTRGDTIPATVPYLSAEPGRVVAWRAQLDALASHLAPHPAPRSVRRVGLVWAGRPTHPNDANRSAPAAAMAPLAAVPGVALVSLQQGAAAAEAAAIAPSLPALGGAIDDFATLAAVISALDLLITVDSAPAHVAGALGCPVWVLLPYGPDWRWLRDRADTPWYPTARLFRPPAPRDWTGLMAGVAAALRRWAAACPRSGPGRTTSQFPTQEARVSKIIRTEPNPILSKAVEFHGFVYLQGMTARDPGKDIKGQTAEVLEEIDAALETHGTDKTRLLTAQIWLKDIKDRPAMNELWAAWLPEGGAPVRACVQAELADPRLLVEIMVTACK